jgi:predicted nucleotidyltransferase
MVAEHEIQELSRRIVREFNPRRIILFGSYADGRPREDSDVDLLVTMDRPDSGRRVAARMIRSLRPRFAVDILIRTEEELAERLRQHDFMLLNAVRQGRVLYEASD